MNQTEVKNLNDFKVVDFLGIKWKRAIEADMPLEFCNALHKDFKDASMYVWAHYKVNDESQLKYHNFAEKYNSLDKNDALYYLETRKENKEILLKVREEATKAYNNGLFTQNDFKFDFEKDEYRNNLNEKLLESAISGNLETMKKCLKNGADVNYTESFEGKNALIYACRNDIAKNQFELVETLIKHGADVNYNDKYGETPLLFILKEEEINFDIAKLLIENGAEVNKEDQHQISNTPLSWCIINKSNVNLEFVKYLISKGADVNQKNNFGDTPLMESVSYNKIKATKLLIEHGADVNAQNQFGNTALILASANGHTQIAKLLIENGANVNVKDENGNTALMWASENGYYDIAKILIQHGADVNAVNNKGKNALITSCWRSDSSSYHIEFLIQHGADVNVEDKDCGTALMYAASNGNIDIVKTLIENGADVNLKDNHNYTALDYANSFRDRKRAEVAEFLIEHGAKTSEELENNNEESQTIRKRR